MPFKRIVNFYLLFLLFSINIFAVEFGLIAGKNTEPSATTMGFSAGMGMLIPMVNFEFEMMKKTDVSLKEMAVGVKIRKKIGGISPYVVIGAGTRFEKFSITFSGYDYYTYIGGGLHYHIIHFFSIRGDVRYQSYADFNNVRLSIGIFAHL